MCWPRSTVHTWIAAHCFQCCLACCGAPLTGGVSCLSFCRGSFALLVLCLVVSPAPPLSRPTLKRLDAPRAWWRPPTMSPAAPTPRGRAACGGGERAREGIPRPRHAAARAPRAAHAAPADRVGWAPPTPRPSRARAATTATRLRRRAGARVLTWGGPSPPPPRPCPLRCVAPTRRGHAAIVAAAGGRGACSPAAAAQRRPDRGSRHGARRAAAGGRPPSLRPARADRAEGVGV